MLWRTKFFVMGGGLALLMFGAGSASAHSVSEAMQTLYEQGYRDVRVERASLPYSFNACKRGVRYHVHVDYYGDLVQVDAMGSCNGYGSDYEDRGRYDGRYRYRGSDYGERAPYDSRYRYR